MAQETHNYEDEGSTLARAVMNLVSGIDEHEQVRIASAILMTISDRRGSGGMKLKVDTDAHRYTFIVHREELQNEHE